MSYRFRGPCQTGPGMQVVNDRSWALRIFHGEPIPFRRLSSRLQGRI